MFNYLGARARAGVIFITVRVFSPTHKGQEFPPRYTQLCLTLAPLSFSWYSLSLVLLSVVTALAAAMWGSWLLPTLALELNLAALLAR